MKLSDLSVADTRTPDDALDVDVQSITADSRAVRPGALFVALSGAKSNGAAFAADAAAKGAVAVLASNDAVLPDLPVPVLRSDEPRRALALMAARFFGRQPAVAVAVTGTSGKTSVAEFTRQIFAGCGLQAASVGTIGVVKPDGGVYGSLTTPDPVTLHETLADLAQSGVTHLAFEASSHGLDQHRLDGVELTAGGFTNLGRDHLDYHPDMESYLNAKMRLFRDLLQPGQRAVINADDTYTIAVQDAAKERGLEIMTVGERGEALQLTDVRVEGFAQRLTVRHAGGSQIIKLPLLGTYQASNALIAAGLAIAAGQETEPVLGQLAALKGVKGRLDIVGEARGGMAVVDYAHKPEALAAVLDALRPFATGRLICVFGCGGDRDRGKRPIMGQIAESKADIVIVTDDNPRSEDAASIRSEILAAAPSAQEIGDRAEAISSAVQLLGKGDVVVVAGKGHETGQIVGDTVLPFSDHEALSEALNQAR